MHADLPGLTADQTALFLDVDGTLVEIRSRPSDVVVEASLLDLLDRLERKLGGALALVSGRSLTEIDRLFGDGRFSAAGAHGAEIRVAGERLPASVPGSLPEAIESRMVELVDRHNGLMLERKRGGVSLHYRGAPSLESACREAVTAAMAGLGEDYRLIAGKMVFEIAPRGHDKGAAVHVFLSRPPFKGRTAMFVGDDVTDEDGFRAANESGGTSVRVGTSDGSAAQYKLIDVAAVHRWLTEQVD